MAFGQHLAIASLIVWTIPALMLNKPSLVILGFRGTPAEMITSFIPVSASSSCCYPKNPRTTAPVSIWLVSEVTLGVLTTSYRWRTETKVFIFINMAKGWLMPPVAPSMATL
ncbi:hypothetical protein ACFX19_038092 [Malus domestica]